MLMSERGAASIERPPKFQSKALQVLQSQGVLCFDYLKENADDIYESYDLQANSSQQQNLQARAQYMCLFDCLFTETFIPAGSVGLIMNAKNEYLFAAPGMHLISGIFSRTVGAPLDLGQRTKVICHGNRTAVIVESGYIGYAMDNGIPVLLPEGLHAWTSHSMHFIRSVPLDDHIVELGPYTILTVDEGYAAVTQDNGKQKVLSGGATHFLNHKNWKFQKFMSLKVQSDDVQRTLATTADNIELIISATVTWRIVDVLKAAVNAESTMAISGKLADASVQLGFNDNLGTDLIASLKDDLTDGRITQEEYHALLEEAMRGSTESVYSDRSKVTASNTSRRGGGSGAKGGKASFEAGDRIEARFKGKGSAWYPGVVVRVHPVDGTLDLNYDDGDKESGALPENVRHHSTESPKKSGRGGGAAGRKGKKGPGGGGGGGSEGGAGSDEVSGLSKIRHDVLRQCLASLAGFVGGVRFSTTFGLSAANHSTGGSGSGGNRGEDNPMQNKERLLTAVHHANTVTMKYGVEVININIIEASPLDDELSTALASGAVAAADALQAETSARGAARSVAIEAAAAADQRRIEAKGVAESEVIRARGEAEAAVLAASGSLKSAQELSGNKVAVELATMDKSAEMLQGGEKMFFGQEPKMLSNIVLKGL